MYPLAIIVFITSTILLPSGRNAPKKQKNVYEELYRQDMIFLNNSVHAVQDLTVSTIY